MSFKPAKAHDRKLKMLLTGPTGSGKTLSALQIAFGLCDQGIGVIDSEYGRASDYEGFEGLGKYQTLELTNYSPLHYKRALEEGIKEGFNVLIIDSLTQEWFGPGGTLEIVNKAANQPNKNSYTAWAVGRPLHDEFITKIISAPVHIICTCRSKMEHEIVKEEGKTKINRLGLSAMQSPDIEYEFMLVGQMNMSHELEISITHGTRLMQFENQVIESPFQALGEQLKGALSDT